METLIYAVRIHSLDIELECDMLIVKNSKRHITDGMELPYEEREKNARRKRNLLILGNMGADNIKQVEMKEQIKKIIIGEQESYV